MTLAAPVLVTTKATPVLFHALLLSTAGLAFVFGAMQNAQKAVEAAPEPNFLRQVPIDLSQVLV